MIHLTNEEDCHGKDAGAPLPQSTKTQAQQEKEYILQGVKEGYLEMLEMEKEGRPGKTWEQLMKELNEEV